MLCQAIEASVPEASIVLKPFIDFLQWRCLKMARPPLRLFALRYQPRRLQNFEVLGYGGDAHGVRLRELLHGRIASRKTGQNTAARRVSER